MLLLTIILIFLCIISFLVYILLVSKRISVASEKKKLYGNLISVIWLLCIFGIPLSNTNLLVLVFPLNISYFGNLGFWFIFLGIIFIIISVRLVFLIRKDNKIQLVRYENPQMTTKGIHAVMRSPESTSSTLVFIGLAFILDSFVSILFAPFLVVLFELKALYEEKCVFQPKFGEKFTNYKEKTKHRQFPQPYNYLLIIIALLTLFVGFVNFSGLYGS